MRRLPNWDFPGAAHRCAVAGRSPGWLTTKIHALVGARSLPLELVFDAGPGG